MGLDKLKPSQLIALTLLGGILAALGFPALLPRFPHGSSLMYAQLVISVGLTVGGLILSLKSSSAIENGIAADRWTSEATTTLRATLESSLLRILSVAFLVAAVFVMIAFHHQTALAFSPLIMAQTIQRLQSIAKPPTNRHPPFDWQNGNAIQSEHWGHARNHAL